MNACNWTDPKHVLFAAFSLLLLAGCGSDKNASTSPIAPPAGNQNNPVIDTRSELCFPGVDGSGTDACFKISEQENIEDPDGDFQYLDPETDPSFPSSFEKSWYRAPVRFVDLDVVDPNKYVAPNFVIGEFMAAWKGRYGVFSRDVILLLEELRARISAPVFVNSGYRSPGYNAGINGAARWSRHQYGDAVDFYSDGASLTELQNICRDLGASFTRVYTTHIHCDWRARGGDPGYHHEHADSLPANEDREIGRLELQGIERVTWRKISKNGRVRFIEFYFEEKFPEDPGEVRIKWRIQSPNGKIFEADASSIQVPWRAGTYKISADIGGTYQIDSQETEIW